MRPLRIVRTHQDDGTLSPELLTNIKAKAEPKRGSMLINIATALLFVLALVLWAVSLYGQYKFIVAIKGAPDIAWAQAATVDAIMAVLSLLALGMARAGLNARIARGGVVAFAGLSAFMNFAAAGSYNWRVILVYVMAPIALAFVTDVTVMVVKRHYLKTRNNSAEAEASVWVAVGRFLARVIRMAAVIALYSLRLVLDFKPTVMGLRRMVLNAAPVPSDPVKFRPLPILTSERPDAVIVPDPARAAESPACKAVTAPQRSAARKAVQARVTPLALAPVPSGPKRFTPRPGTKTDRLIQLAITLHGSLTAIPADETAAIASKLAQEIGLDGGAARAALKKAVKAARAATETDEEASA
jgi:hypothetical protein